MGLIKRLNLNNSRSHLSLTTCLKGRNTEEGDDLPGVQGFANLFKSQGSEAQDCVLEVEIFDVKRVLLDEFAAWFNHIAHQFSEQIIGFGHIRNFDLQQCARVRV